MKVHASQPPPSPAPAPTQPLPSSDPVRSVPLDPEAQSHVTAPLVERLVESVAAAASPSSDYLDLASSPSELRSRVGKLLAAAALELLEPGETQSSNGIASEEIATLYAEAAKYTLPQEYSEQELAALNESKDLHEHFAHNENRVSRVKTGTGLYECEMTSLQDQGGKRMTRSKFVVNASPELMVAYYMGWTNDMEVSTLLLRASTHADKNPHVNPHRLLTYRAQLTGEKTKNQQNPVRMLERSSDHSSLFTLSIPLPGPFSDRELLAHTLWRRVDDGYFVSQASIQHPAFPAKKGVIRTAFLRTCKLSVTLTGETQVEMVGQVSCTRW